MPTLRVKSGPETGTVFKLTGEKVLIGRDPDAEVRVLDQGVSRRHAEIVRIGELYILRDCGSRNGTFVNDEQVQERVLREGDKIRVGGSVLVFEDRSDLLGEGEELTFHDGAIDPRETLLIETQAVSEPVVGDRRPTVEASVLLDALEQIAQVLSAAKGLREILSQAIAALGKAVGARAVYVLQRKQQAEKDEFHLLASWSPEGAKPPLKISRTVLLHACRQGAPLLVNNVGRDQRFLAQESIIAHAVESVLCAPIRVQGRILGVLYAADSAAGGGFSAEDLELFGGVATQIGLAIAFHRAQRRTEAFFRKGMGIIVAALEHRMPEKRGEAQRVANFCAAIGRAMHLDPLDVRNAWLSGLLHDIAILGLSDRELSEPVLLPLRRNRAAEALLGEVKEFAPVLEAIQNQDERYDGSGGPEGKKGDEIPLLGQIVGLAKEFDRLVVGDIITGAEHSVRDAVLKIHDLRGKWFAPQVVDAFIVAYRKGELFRADQPFALVAI